MAETNAAKQLLNDPQFYSKPLPEQINELGKAYPPFLGLPDDAKQRILTQTKQRVQKKYNVGQPPTTASAPSNGGPPAWYDRPMVPLQNAIDKPKPGQSGPAQFTQGLVRGAAGGAAELTTPKNVGLMGTMAAASTIPVVGQVVDVAAGAYFTYGMAKNLVDSIPEAKKAFQDGDWGRLGEILGQDVVAALVARKAGKATVGKALGRGPKSPTSRENTTPSGTDPQTTPAKGGGKTAIPVSAPRPEPIKSPVKEPAASPAAAPQPKLLGPGPAPTPATSPTKPLWEMSHKELAEAEAKASSEDNWDLETLFGAEGAKKYKALERKANSTTRSHAETNAASAELEKMEASLSKEQRNKLYGIGDDGPQYSEIREYRQALSKLNWESPEALGDSLKWAVTGIGDKDNPADMNTGERVRYAQLRYAMDEAKRIGWNTQLVSEHALRGAAGRFSPEDAPFMLRRFLNRGPRTQTAAPPETAKALPPAGPPGTSSPNGKAQPDGPFAVGPPTIASAKPAIPTEVKESTEKVHKQFQEGLARVKKEAPEKKEPFAVGPPSIVSKKVAEPPAPTPAKTPVTAAPKFAEQEPTKPAASTAPSVQAPNPAELREAAQNVLQTAQRAGLERIKVTARNAKGENIFSAEYDTDVPHNVIADPMETLPEVATIEIAPVGNARGMKAWTKTLTGKPIGRHHPVSR
jgi:hypothetical protein